MIYVGIDIASEKHDYFMLQKETGIVFRSSSVTIGNNEAGYKKLHSDTQSFCGATGDSNVRIGLESTGIYHTNIIRFLLEQNYDVMMINPILTNMARKAAKVHSAKNDNLDAQTICKYLIDNPDKFSPYTLSLYHNEALKSLSRKRFFIVEDLRKAKLAVNSLIQVIFPEFKTLFSNIYGDSAIAILKAYGTPQALARAHVSKVASLIHGRCKCTAEQLISAAKTSIGISEPHYAFQLMDAIEEMEHISRRIKNYDLQIKAYVDELCPNLLSIPGVGYTTVGLIAGEIRDIDRFHSAESLISLTVGSMLPFMSPANTRRRIVCLLKRAPSICVMHSFRCHGSSGSTTPSSGLTTRKSSLRGSTTTSSWDIFKRRSSVSFIPSSKTLLLT